MEMSEKQMHILAVAESLFASKGYEGSSVRDIAQAADVNVAMISYYFGSKEKLLQSLIMERMRWAGLMLEELIQNKTMSPWEKMDAIIDFYVDRMLKNRDYHTILSRQMSLAQNEELTKILVEIKRRNSEMIFQIINEGKEKGMFRDVDNELTIGTVIGTISQVSMSRPFYCSLLNIAREEEVTYYKLIEPRLKKHLKNLLRAYLSLDAPK